MRTSECRLPVTAWGVDGVVSNKAAAAMFLPSMLSSVKTLSLDQLANWPHVGRVAWPQAGMAHAGVCADNVASPVPRTAHNEPPSPCALQPAGCAAKLTRCLRARVSCCRYYKQDGGEDEHYAEKKYGYEEEHHEDSYGPKQTSICLMESKRVYTQSERYFWE